MHVEVNVALNFVVSYLYSKLPRRRVDLFGAELEKGLKQKFEGHWYPDKPFKGSGYRCVRCNGEKVDPVIMTAARSAGLDLQEVKEHIPEELTLWIDPSEVSYRLSERSPIKVLYSDRREEEEEEEACDTMDQEVQVANHTFNPEASSFQPIDPLTSPMADFHLPPSSPVSSSIWGSSMVMPPTSFSPPQSLQPSPPAPVMQQSPFPLFMGKPACTPQFTAATFAATKFGSTKLKSQAKRPTRLSPTELGNYFRQQQQQQQQQQNMGYNNMIQSPQRPRSLSPRDPRVEFMMDQHQRFNVRGQLSPQGQHGFGHPLNHQHLAFPPSPLSPGTGLPADFMRHSPSPHLSPMGMATFPEMLSPGSHSSGSLSGIQSPASSLSPEGHRSFLDDLQHLHNMHSYPGHLQHLLVAN